MRKKNYFYVDMDGVLADFYSMPNAVQEFASKENFFADLQPIQDNLQAVKQLIANGESVRILSASPNERCDNDKILWLKRYLPEIARKNIIIMRNGQRKVDFMATKQGILFDDYGKNLREWETKVGNKGYKITTEISINQWVMEL